MRSTNSRPIRATRFEWRLVRACTSFSACSTYLAIDPLSAGVLIRSP
jgi:hypothetical protein